MKYAVIENNKVVNVVVADEEFARQQGWVKCEDSVGIEWDYIDGQFVNNMPVPEKPAEINTNNG